MKEPIIFYMHAGSGNHGCEAIVNSMCHMINHKVLLVSNDAKEDEKYTLKGSCEITQERKFDTHKLAHIVYYIYRKLTGDKESFIRYRYRDALRVENAPLAVSIGGDNYCYEMMLQDLRLANNAFRAAGKKTVLLGCSIEPDLLLRKEIKEDLAGYHTIIARESITYEALLQAFPQDNLPEMKNLSNTNENTPRILLCPDPAFTLEKQETHFPEGFEEGNTIGLNLSPLIQESETKGGITMLSYKALVEHILEATNCKIALIPHVVWDRNDDCKPLRELYDAYQNTGRVLLVTDRSCAELKDIILKCKLFIGARTHATIAAYSTLIPTLVVGYSVKARGIARDLFGTYENYVLPVQSLTNQQELIDAYDWLADHEKEIKHHLEEVMPEYMQRAYKQGEIIEKLAEEN